MNTKEGAEISSEGHVGRWPWISGQFCQMETEGRSSKNVNTNTHTNMQRQLHNSLTPINMHQTQPKLHHIHIHADRQTDIPDMKGSNPSGEFSLLPSAEMILSFD
ncbi:unnamed protein product [Brugia timori]|uniref:Ovule protein n=1 Tax=Brugia timori TaxID=42155 RepID=A0A0R3R2W1_9BILA|nr:unnamed protein product [Brugia timori]